MTAAVKIRDMSFRGDSLEGNGVLKLGTVVRGRFTQKGARSLPHEIQDAEYRTSKICICGEDILHCQDCCGEFHTDEMPMDKHGEIAEYCAVCLPKQPWRP
jgi:hypothetical protein